MGVWIETNVRMQRLLEQSVTPCVGVWIETFVPLQHSHMLVSHPAWVCGLKLSMSGVWFASLGSHPAWVCGLKLQTLAVVVVVIGHTLRGCVD